MAVERRFLIAPSFARLIQQQCRAMDRIVEGHFPPRPERSQFVRLERERALLILGQRQGNGPPVAEELAEIPHAHAEALIDVAPGSVAFDRMVIELGEGRKALLDRFIVPQGLDVLTILMEDDPEGHCPEWLGPEVTGRPEYEASSLAIRGRPPSDEVAITNSGLEALLDTLEGQPDLSISTASLPTEARPETTRSSSATLGSSAWVGVQPSYAIGGSDEQRDREEAWR